MLRTDDGNSFGTVAKSFSWLDRDEVTQSQRPFDYSIFASARKIILVVWQAL